MVVETHNKPSHDLDAEFIVKGLCAAGEFVAVYGQKNVAVYELVKDFAILRSAGESLAISDVCSTT